MPIIGLTDSASIVPQFPRLGKLRKGGEAVEKTNAKGETYRTYGPDLEYFRFTEERPGALAAFTAAYGPEPRTLRVFLPYVTLEENFPTWWEKWSASGLQARSDGVMIHQWRTPDGRYSFQPQPMPDGWQETRDWRRIGRLSLILPDLFQRGFVGYVTLDLSGIHDLTAITGTLAMVLLSRDTLQGIEFTLRRQWEEIATPRPGGQRAMVKKSLVKMEPSQSWAALQIALAQQAALGGTAAPLQLADGRTIDSATGEILDEAPPVFEDDEEPGRFRPLGPEPAAQSPSTQEPVCPICGGPMWDNREKAKASSKRMPEWSCKAGKYDTATKTKSGCEGVLWPGQFVSKTATGPQKISKAQIDELGVLIKSVYGTDPAELTKVKTYMVGRFQVDDRSKLTAKQADEFAAELLDMLNKLTGAGQPELIPGDSATSPYTAEIPL